MSRESNDEQSLQSAVADELDTTAWRDYRKLSSESVTGDRRNVERVLAELLTTVLDQKLLARIHNDLGVLAAVDGRIDESVRHFSEAVGLIPDLQVAQENHRLISWQAAEVGRRNEQAVVSHRSTRVGIVSLLFNWPSTGGGTVHTAELARFLSRAGYEVRHFVIGYAGWSVGQVSDVTDWPIERLDFDDSAWHRAEIQRRVRRAVDTFSPDAVIITDSWSFKPRLAEALQGTPYYLRLAAQECLCPLNNVRLLWDTNGNTRACPQHQLATPDICSACVGQRSRYSGALHRAERELAGFDEPDYGRCLREAFAGATGVLVVNPLIAEMVKPHTPAVHVVPSGFDASRFPWTQSNDLPNTDQTRILFAGLVEEPMKGFTILEAAAKLIWQQRKDFRLIVTSDPVGESNEFTEFVGWKSQQELPRLMRESDIVVCPTIAEEALGRTAVEGMGAGRPVVASRIGGLPFVVLDEATGLLCEPSDPVDLARQLVRLLNDRQLQKQMGQAGRRRFEQHYTWEVILDRHYRQLLGAPVRSM